MNVNRRSPERFEHLEIALIDALGKCGSRFDRVEVLVALVSTYQEWLRENVQEEVRTPAPTLATEHETAENLTRMLNAYWADCRT